MKQILITHLNKLIDEIAKKHFVSKEQVIISYEMYTFYYTVKMGNNEIKRELEL